MKSIKIAYVDFWKDLLPEEFIFTKILREKYDVTIDNESPDYVFSAHLGYGNKHYDYDCIRIELIGENIRADLNAFDYSIASDYFDMGDRYLRYPFWMFGGDNVNLAKMKHLNVDVNRERKFCNFVVSNGNADPFREFFYQELTTYKKIDSGGRYKNNLPDGHPVLDKLKFQADYKFSLAFENSSTQGYTTEKILDAYAAGTIPVYWGDQYIGRDFNENSFINITRENYKEKIELIKQIDQDDILLYSYLKSPAFVNENIVENYNDKLRNFLWYIVDNGKHGFRRSGKIGGYGEMLERHYQELLGMQKLVNKNRILHKYITSRMK